MKAPWSDIIPDEEIRRYEASGFGQKSGLGKKPALLIIDVQYRTIGTERKGFWDSIEEYKTSCGDAGWDAVDNIVPLLKTFREKGWPVLYPHVAPKESFDLGRLADKVPALMNVDAAGYRFVDAIAPEAGEILLPKKHPSAFFGTPLLSYLIDQGVDSLVVTGATTSGCVRGTVVDGFSYNFRVTVPQECVFDRVPTAHAANLFDMAYKYADVRPLDEVLQDLRAIG